MDPARNLFMVAPSGKHTHTVILLHRARSSGEELYNELQEYRTSSGQNIFEALPSASTKWVFPTSRMNDWTASVMKDFDGSDEYDIVGYRHNVERIRMLLQTLKYEDGVQDENVILGGFGQGFAAASQVLLTMPDALAGFVGVSGWIPYVKQNKAIMQRARDDRTVEPYFHAMYSPIPFFGRGNATNTPVFVSRSKSDDEEVEDEVLDLRNLGHEVEYHSYDYEEEPLKQPRGCDDLVAFLTPLLKG